MASAELRPPPGGFAALFAPWPPTAAQRLATASALRSGTGTSGAVRANRSRSRDSCFPPPWFDTPGSETGEPFLRPTPARAAGLTWDRGLVAGVPDSERLLQRHLGLKSFHRPSDERTFVEPAHSFLPLVTARPAHFASNANAYADAAALPSAPGRGHAMDHGNLPWVDRGPSTGAPQSLLRPARMAHMAFVLHLLSPRGHLPDIGANWALHMRPPPRWSALGL